MKTGFPKTREAIIAIGPAIVKLLGECGALSLEDIAFQLRNHPYLALIAFGSHKRFLWRVLNMMLNDRMIECYGTRKHFYRMRRES